MVSAEEQQSTRSEVSCRCILPPSDMSLPVGEVNSVSGDVLMTQNTGYSGPVAGAPIVQGSIIRVGQNSSVALRFQDTCFIDAPATSTVSVQPIENGICVSVDEGRQAAVVPPNGGPNVGIIAVVAGVTAAGIGVAVGLGGGSDDDDSEPASR